MKKSVGTPFRSEYGFSGPGFIVDDQGNISAKSLTTQDGSSTGTGGGTSSTITDLKMLSTDTYFFLESAPTVINPTLTIERNRRYIIELALTDLSFYIYRAGMTTLLDTGISHSDGTSGLLAQGKSTGLLNIFFDGNFTDDVLYYSNNAKTIVGTINVIDPVGVFNTVTVNGGIQSTSSTTGSLIVAGGIGIDGDIFLSGSLKFDGVGPTQLYSPTDLVIGADNKIEIKIDNSKVGSINSNGISIPINTSNIVDSNINNTPIGNVTPSSAAFTQAIVTGVPTTDLSVANKKYVDQQSVALAIAFGF